MQFQKSCSGAIWIIAGWPLLSLFPLHDSAYHSWMPFDITIRREFSASHQLKLYDGSLEPLHGHNWRIEVSVGAEKLDEIGVVMDFHELQRILDEIVAPMHNRHLNDLPSFAARNPSTENVALHIAQSIKLTGHIKLRSVEVWETNDCRAKWLA